MYGNEISGGSAAGKEPIMAKVTLTHPPIHKPVDVLLTRKWSDWDEGDIITMDSEKAERVIAKGYGERHKQSRHRGRIVETATAEPSGEQAVVTPAKGSKPEPPGESANKNNKDSKPAKTKEITNGH